VPIRSPPPHPPNGNLSAPYHAPLRWDELSQSLVGFNPRHSFAIRRYQALARTGATLFSTWSRLGFDLLSNHPRPLLDKEVPCIVLSLPSDQTYNKRIRSAGIESITRPSH
jgi:hypothetical protein